MTTRYQSTAVFDENNQTAMGKSKAGAAAQPRRALRNITNATAKQPRGLTSKDKVQQPVSKRSVGLRVRSTNVPAPVATTKAHSHAHVDPPTPDDVTDMDMEEVDDIGKVTAETVDPSTAVSSSSSTAEVDEVDLGDVDNELFVSEYILDIMQHLKDTETKYQADPNYMDSQPDLTPKMREILIDWLIEVHAKFKLRTETLYLCVNLVDRFLSVREIKRSKLQLVGITAMLLASKYEEIWAIEVRDFVYIADKAYTKEEILHMEGVMLSALGFHLTTPSIYRFLERWVKVSGGDQRMMFLACFLSESTLQKVEFMGYKPSHVAASAVYLTNRLSNQVPWNATLQKHTGYSEKQLMDCVSKMYAVIQEEKPKFKGVRRKYAHAKYMAVSRIAPGDMFF